MPVAYGHREVLIRGYVDEVVISCGAEVIARHRRSYDSEDLIFDPLHYLPLIEQKIGALDQAAPLAGWDCYTEDEQRNVFSHPLCMPGSDATTMAPDGPFAEEFFHGAYSWASWYYRFMVRETKALSPAEAIHRMTGLPARVLNLTDRGAIVRGARADIAVFDPATFGERATTYEPNRLAAGMAHVIANGVHTLDDGVLTGDRERGGEVLLRR